jgi:hypothetical protein
MKHVVSFSGGRTSAYLVHLMEEKRKYEGWDVEYVFMDTGAEHPETYEFIKNIVNEWGVNLICLKAVINPTLGVGVNYEKVGLKDLKWDMSLMQQLAMKHGTPCFKAPDCTKLLKNQPFSKFCNETFGRGNYITWLGIRADEKRRLKPRDGVKYLAEIDWITKPEVVAWWSRQSFDLNIPEWLGNCVFCVKKDIKKVALAQKQEPELAISWMDTFSSDGVRQMKNENPQEMYRMNLTLPKIIEMYERDSEEDLSSLVKYQRVCGSRCEQSCELDLFEEDAA